MAQIEFTRGDANSLTFNMPAESWSPGGHLFFAAKESIDDDFNDAAAVINAEFDDTNVSDVVINGKNYKRYTCSFPPSTTLNIPSNGDDLRKYKGEFQFVTAAGIPTTFPARDKKLEVIVYFDVKRSTT